MFLQLGLQAAMLVTDTSNVTVWQHTGIVHFQLMFMYENHKQKLSTGVISVCIILLFKCIIGPQHTWVHRYS